MIWTIRFCSNLTSMWYRHFVRYTWKDLKTFNACISNGSMEEIERQIYCKSWFFDRVFYVTIDDADIVSLKSLYTLLIGIWITYYILNIVLSKLYKVLSFLFCFVLFCFFFVCLFFLKNCSPFLAQHWCNFGRLSCDWKYNLMLLSIWRLSCSVPEITVVRHV